MLIFQELGVKDQLHTQSTQASQAIIKSLSHTQPPPRWPRQPCKCTPRSGRQKAANIRSIPSTESGFGAVTAPLQRRYSRAAKKAAR